MTSAFPLFFEVISLGLQFQRGILFLCEGAYLPVKILTDSFVCLVETFFSDLNDNCCDRIYVKISSVELENENLLEM